MIWEYFCKICKFLVNVIVVRNHVVGAKAVVWQMVAKKSKNWETEWRCEDVNWMGCEWRSNKPDRRARKWPTWVGVIMADMLDSKCANRAATVGGKIMVFCCRWLPSSWGVFWHKKVEKIFRVTWFYPNFFLKKSSFSTFWWKRSVPNATVIPGATSHGHSRVEEEEEMLKSWKKNLGKTMLP